MLLNFLVYHKKKKKKITPVSWLEVLKVELLLHGVTIFTEALTS